MSQGNFRPRCVHLLLLIPTNLPCAPGSAVSDVFVKVNFAPYLLTVDLLHEVDDANAVARFEDRTLHLQLKKVRCPLRF